MVGTLYGADTPPSPGLFDLDHEGHGGFRTDQIDSALNSYLPGNAPDTVLSHLGTNDISQGADLDDAKESVSYIITKLRNQNPNVAIFLAKIIKRAPAYDNTIAIYNGLMGDLSDEENTVQSPVTLVDQYIGYDNSIHNQADQLHPNDLGDTFMTNRWFDTLRPKMNQYCSP